MFKIIHLFLDDQYHFTLENKIYIFHILDQKSGSLYGSTDRLVRYGPRTHGKFEKSDRIRTSKNAKISHWTVPVPKQSWQFRTDPQRFVDHWFCVEIQGPKPVGPWPVYTIWYSETLDPTNEILNQVVPGRCKDGSCRPKHIKIGKYIFEKWCKKKYIWSVFREYLVFLLWNWIRTLIHFHFFCQNF